MRASEVRGLYRTPRTSDGNTKRSGPSLLKDTFAPTGLLGESSTDIGEQDHSVGSCPAKVHSVLVSWRN